MFKKCSLIHLKVFLLSLNLLYKSRKEAVTNFVLTNRPVTKGEVFLFCHIVAFVMYLFIVEVNA